MKCENIRIQYRIYLKNKKWMNNFTFKLHILIKKNQK